MKSSADHWWLHCSAVLRYMPGEGGKSIADIIAELPDVAADGYQAIQITAPYASAGFFPWWGLRPLDYFSINEALCGDMADFSALVNECHRLGLRVVLFLNIGYCDVSSPLWKTACLDKCRGLHSAASGLFLWSDSITRSFPQPTGTHFLQGGDWLWSDDAGCYYYSYWRNGTIAEPQYDWLNPAVHAYMESVLEHWLTTGADGIIVDAVNRLLNCSMPIIRRCITDIIHRHPEVMCIPEGATGFGDSFGPWLSEGGFDMIEDQPFHSDLHWNGSAIMNALRTGNPALIECALNTCREVRRAGSACWSYLSWGDEWTPERRLLEIALLIATGHMTEIIPSYLRDFRSEHHECMRRILHTVRFRALAPCCERISIPVNLPASCCAYLCPSGDTPVVCVFNLSENPQRVRLSSGNRGCAWFDHIAMCHVISEDDILTFDLPPCSFAFATPDR